MEADRDSIRTCGFYWDERGMKMEVKIQVEITIVWAEVDGEWLEIIADEKFVFAGVNSL